jgi:hypothetical protein
MDISTLYQRVAPIGRPRNRHIIPPAKSPQDRKRRQKRRDRKPNYDDDVIVTLSGIAPTADPKES